MYLENLEIKIVRIFCSTPSRLDPNRIRDALIPLKCNTHFWSDPIGGSEPFPGCSFNSFCLLFICLFFFFFCKSVATRIPGPTRRANPNWSPVYFDCFHLFYQNILFMLFFFRVFNYVEALLNGRP